MGKFRIVLTISVTAAMMLFYTNCSGDYGEMSALNSKVSASSQKGPVSSPAVIAPGGGGNNGGGFSGKASFDFFDYQFSCQNGISWIQQLDVDFDNQNAYLQEQKCNQSNEGSVLFNDIFFTAYDPWFAWYDNNIFANRKIHESLEYKSISYPVFCYDTTNRVDFAVQYYRPLPVNGVKQQVQIHGYVVDGNTPDNPPTRTRGHLGDPTEHRTFTTGDDSYVVHLHSPPATPRLGTGELVFADGTTYNMECRFYVPESTE